MTNFKNAFYRKLKLPQDIKNTITFYNEIKKLMLKDLGSQGYFIKRKKEKK